MQAEAQAKRREGKTGQGLGAGVGRQAQGGEGGQKGEGGSWGGRVRGKQSYREADHGVGQRRIGVRVLRPQPAVVVGARKGARDVGIRRLAQQPGARLAGHSVPTRLG